MVCATATGAPPVIWLGKQRNPTKECFVSKVDEQPTSHQQETQRRRRRQDRFCSHFTTTTTTTTVGTRQRSQISLKSYLCLLFVIFSTIVCRIGALELRYITDGDSLTTCVDFLWEADTNGDAALQANEFPRFIALATSGAINTTSFGQVPLRLVVVYHWVACLCTLTEGPDSNCCLGAQSHIDLNTGPPDEDTALLLFCSQIDEGISSVLPEPTASPTTAPPSSAASASPTPLLASNTPTTTTTPSPSLPSASNSPSLRQSNVPSSSSAPGSGSPSVRPTSLSAPSRMESSTPTMFVQPSVAPTWFPSHAASMAPTDADAPSDRPTMSPSTHPSTMPTTIPTTTPTTMPTTMPTTTPTTTPTTMPSSSPSTIPSFGPSFSPSTIPSYSPSSSPSFSPSLLESDIPSVSAKPSMATMSPSERDSFSPSSIPSGPLPSEVPSVTAQPSIATMSPSERDSFRPSSIPSEPFPSTVPSVSAQPSIATTSPSATASLSPSRLPSLFPSPSPSAKGQICINFQYSLTNDKNLTASQLLNEENNTLKTGLEIATRTVLISILNSTFPEFGVAGSAIRGGGDTGLPNLDVTSFFEFKDQLRNHRQHQSFLPHQRKLLSWEASVVEEAVVIAIGDAPETVSYVHRVMTLDSGQPPLAPAQRRLRGSRQLVVYTDDVPIEITNIIDAPSIVCPPSPNPFARCAVVSTTVCVILGPNDDEQAVRLAISDGLAASFRNGQFQNAIPAEHQP